MGSSNMPNIVAVLEEHRHKSNSSFAFLKLVLLLKRANIHKCIFSIYCAKSHNGAHGEIHTATVSSLVVNKRAHIFA